jgi:hypothetical protein
LAEGFIDFKDSLILNYLLANIKAKWARFLERYSQGLWGRNSLKS